MKKKVNKARSLAMKKSWAERRNSPMREQARKRADALGDKLAKKELKNKPKGEAKFWILWAPSSNKPPRVRFATLEHVKNIADQMVVKYKMDVYVMQSVELHRLGKPEVVVYNGPAKKPELVKNTVSKGPEPSAVAFMSKHGQPWRNEERERLVCMYAGTNGYGKHTIQEIAQLLGRSSYAIECQLHNMGLRDKPEAPTARQSEWHMFSCGG